MSFLLTIIALSIASIGLACATLAWKREGGLHRLSNRQLSMLTGMAAISASCLISAFLS